MNLKELAFPIRVYWDLTPVSDAPSINYKLICEQIVEMKFFTLNLLETGSHISRACIDILEQLTKENITISLTVSPSVFISASIEHICDLKIHELLVDASSDELPLISEQVQRYKERNVILGASLQVREDNYRTIPDVLSFCLKNNINRLVFPMQRLQERSDCFYVSKKEGNDLSQRLSALEFENMKITIHDPFLWRIFYPAVSFPGGGCQAANSMVYISSEGKVYPCPTMPIELGDLKEMPLRTILSSDSKKKLVKDLHKAPEECKGCDELSGCMGGCSGRVYVLDGSINLKDPACKES